MADEIETETEVVVPETHETPADPPAFDRGALESRVATTMANMFKEDGDDIDEKSVETPEVKPAKVSEDTAADSEAEQVEKAADPGEQAPKPTPATVDPASIPDAYSRSLKAYGWTDEEISRASKVDPVNFLKTAERIHANRNEETRRMSDLGRQMRAQEAQQAATRTKPTETPKAFTPIDIPGLKAKYGDEPFVAQLENINGLVAWANQVMPVIQASQARQQQAELDTLSRQIDGFFSSKDMAPYYEHYGKLGAKLTDKQATTRQSVLETADLLISGARAMGRSITLDEALSLAHDSVSGPIRERAAAHKIQQQVKTRNQAISLRPGSRAGASVSADPRIALQRTVKAGLAKAFK